MSSQSIEEGLKKGEKKRASPKTHQSAKKRLPKIRTEKLDDRAASPATWAGREKKKARPKRKKMKQVGKGRKAAGSCARPPGRKTASRRLYGRRRKKRGPEEYGGENAKINHRRNSETSVRERGRKQLGGGETHTKGLKRASAERALPVGGKKRARKKRAGH